MIHKAVGERLTNLLSGFKLTPEQLEDYMSKEEHQIKDAYKLYATDHYGGVRNGTMTEDACFSGDVSTVAYCLAMCY